MFRVSCFVFRVSCFVFRVSCFVFRVSCFVFRVSVSFLHMISPLSSRHFFSVNNLIVGLLLLSCQVLSYPISSSRLGNDTVEMSR